MTLILVTINSDYALQVADRRLTVNGKVVEEEQNKAISLVTADTRLSVAFTGLARVGSFDTRTWLVDALHDCAAPDYMGEGLIKRLAERATEVFRTHPFLKHAKAAHKLLDISFAGYLHRADPPLGVFALVSNRDGDVAGDRFYTLFQQEKQPRSADFTYVQRMGWHHAVNDGDIEFLRDVTGKRLGYQDATQLIVGRFRDVAARSSAAGVIGKQLNSIVIPRDLNLPITGDYHSAVIQRATFIADHVVAISPQSSMALMDIRVEPVEDDTPPMSVPPVHRNQPCPCGNGKRYRLCHGAKHRPPRQKTM